MTMLQDTLFLARKDFKYLIRSPFTLLWGFLMPVVFFALIGKVTSGFSGGLPANDPIGVFAFPDAGYLSGEFIRLLRNAKYDPQVVTTPEALRGISPRLTIPAHFTADVVARKPVKIVVERDGSGWGSDYDRIRIGRVCYGLLAQIIAAGRNADSISPEAVREIASRQRAITIDVKPAGRRRIAPTGFQQSVPGSMVQFLVVVMLTSGAVSVLSDRRQGILRRLAASPMSRGSIIAGKTVARLGIGIVQCAFAMLTGTLLFGVDWGAHLGAVSSVVLAYAAFCAALAILLGVLGKTEGQVIGIGILAGNLLSAIGGCWWPIEITPPWMQQLSLFLPTGLTMHALHRLMSFGAGPLEVIPHVAALALFTLLTMWFAARRFRFD